GDTRSAVGFGAPDTRGGKSVRSRVERYPSAVRRQTAVEQSVGWMPQPVSLRRRTRTKKPDTRRIARGNKEQRLAVWSPLIHFPAIVTNLLGHSAIQSDDEHRHLAVLRKRVGDPGSVGADHRVVVSRCRHDSRFLAGDQVA